ncbi:hypothetical protein [Parabacteroides sp. FAFU027]|uniref:hypothetical protein n=1 Tax=Parabacteroides sp. FAFU027 TaxID=2922715 RepID=UPI001FAFF8B6|nr:hypothetical protein [Parabacteroides sp. FAFU027]
MRTLTRNVIFLVLVIINTPQVNSNNTGNTLTKNEIDSFNKRFTINRTIYERELNDRLEIENINYQIDKFKRNKAKLEWQYTSSKIIFYFVLLIVMLGLILATLHFIQTFKNLKSLNRNKDESEIEVSIQGIKINTSIIGIMILGFSLAFFYLYLIYVYPLNPIDSDKDILNQKKSIEQTAK